MAYKLYFEDVNVGDTLPGWSRQTDFMSWNRYAAVNDEFVYMHMDDEAGRKALNEQGAFGMGNLPTPTSSMPCTTGSVTRQRSARSAASSGPSTRRTTCSAWSAP